MKTLFLSQEFKYDGSQLKPLFNYLNHNLLGDSCISWIGGCDIPFSHMVDGEDLLQKAEIRGSRMLHFIFEIYDRELAVGVFLQRLFASILQKEIETKSGKSLLRKGDDLYWEDKKMSISIATKSANSVLMHFALNVSNDGTPVKTCSLEDFQIDPQALASRSLQLISDEYEDIITATRKVRTF